MSLTWPRQRWWRSSAHSRHPSASPQQTWGRPSSDSPQWVTVQNIGNQPLDAIANGLVVDRTNFVQVQGSARRRTAHSASR